MIRIDMLLKELMKFPDDSLVYAYEGEITGIVVVDKEGNGLGYIPCEDNNTQYDGPAILED